MIYVYILCSLEQPELISSFESDRQKTSIGLRRIRETAKPIARHRLTEVIATDAVKRARIHYGIAAVGFDHNQTHRLLAASTTRQEGSNLIGSTTQIEPCVRPQVCIGSRLFRLAISSRFKARFRGPLKKARKQERFRAAPGAHVDEWSTRRSRSVEARRKIKHRPRSKSAQKVLILARWTLQIHPNTGSLDRPGACRSADPNRSRTDVIFH